MWEIAPLFSQLLANTSVHFFKDRVKCLYPRDHLLTNVPAPSGPGGTVHLESGLAIEYDWYDFEILAKASLVEHFKMHETTLGMVINPNFLTILVLNLLS